MGGTTVVQGPAIGSLTGRLTGGLSPDPDPYDCAWLVTPDGGHIDVMYPVGWEVLYDPVRLIDPTGTIVATEGDIVRVMGPVGGIGESGCSELMPFSADTVEVLTNQPSSAAPT